MFQQFYSGNELLIWPLIGFLLFLGAFVGVLLYVFIGLRDRDKVDRLASLPLAGGETPVQSGDNHAAEGKVS